MKVAIVGATGLVGEQMIQVLERSDIQVEDIYMVASAKSKGKSVAFNGKDYPVITIDEVLEKDVDVALFSAGGTTSKKEAPRFAAAGIKVIDNSSAWRMDPTKKLVVPEVNAHVLTPDDMIIANPNCSTIQLVVALAPLHKAYGIKRLVVSTYQSYTGSGKKAVDQYAYEMAEKTYDKETAAYPHMIFENCIPHCGDFGDNDYTTEEMKIVHETRKIIGDDSIAITATAVRVPVHGGHSESVNIEFNRIFDVDEARTLLSQSPGITVIDDPSQFDYPMPLFAKNKDEVYVGRLRRDESIENGLNLWVVSDNLRKGAATNTVQIAEYLEKNNLL